MYALDTGYEIKALHRVYMYGLRARQGENRYISGVYTYHLERSILSSINQSINQTRLFDLIF